jgi:hypothetical protein
MGELMIKIVNKSNGDCINELMDEQVDERVKNQWMDR